MQPRVDRISAFMALLFRLEIVWPLCCSWAINDLLNSKFVIFISFNLMQWDVKMAKMKGAA